ncbi:SDR family NAD(P)-dependent oxidoreductase [Streptomyces bauhiniae]|uniref:SDR family NAD(P)-dependent oxidoreductase n=1 Tax=Streptomyces bauhiniae TaxID=2340725 RepID=A0A4Z1DAQ7_9ACTN|nr:SDR family NAD(P)-dependent oxidoreductase [Streptomyces bauhiniae]TGN79376.1 SDR family NAD(P)-dependent oxidoreductase [Streptomyces bauhiniae]
MSKVYFITGAGRGLGADIARQALKAGHRVVATGRRPEKVLEALGGERDTLLPVALDVTDPASARSAVDAAVERFGRIDVLVNNAANTYGGFFETISDAQMRAQLETNLFGPMNVTRAVLPVMRAQRSGHVVSISSLAGLVGLPGTTAYATSKFGLEGWMEALRFDLEPFGIRTTVVEPGYFRTELLTDASSNFAELSIDDYAERSAAMQEGRVRMNGKQPGDPAKLADALLKVVDLEEPPLRFVAGSDAIEAVAVKAGELLAQAEASRELGTGLSHTDAA